MRTTLILIFFGSLGFANTKSLNSKNLLNSTENPNDSLLIATQCEGTKRFKLLKTSINEIIAYLGDEYEFYPGIIDYTDGGSSYHNKYHYVNKGLIFGTYSSSEQGQDFKEQFISEIHFYPESGVITKKILELYGTPENENWENRLFYKGISFTLDKYDKVSFIYLSCF